MLQDSLRAGRRVLPIRGLVVARGEAVILPAAVAVLDHHVPWLAAFKCEARTKQISRSEGLGPFMFCCLLDLLEQTWFAPGEGHG